MSTMKSSYSLTATDSPIQISTRPSAPTRKAPRWPHSQQCNPPGGSELQAGLALAGHDWMTMFFILSGLILTWNYDELLGTRLNKYGLRVYFVARFARIYPLYILTLAVVALSQVHVTSDLLRILQDPKLWQQVFVVQAWSGDLKAHATWCQSVAPDLWKDQAKKRDQQLATCAKK